MVFSGPCPSSKPSGPHLSLQAAIHVVLHKAWRRLGLVDPPREWPDELLLVDGSRTIRVNPREANVSVLEAGGVHTRRTEGTGANWTWQQQLLNYAYFSSKHMSHVKGGNAFDSD